MNKTPIIIFNGPPRSGKDALTEELYRQLWDEEIPVNKNSFKAHMMSIAANILGIPINKFYNLYEKNENEWKDQPDSAGKGVSVRQLLINISEKLIKPTFGNTWFGKKASEVIQRSESGFIPFIHIFSDGGFESEMLQLAKDFPDRLRVVHVFRGDCSFAGDSRNYVELEGIPTLRLFNEGTIQESVRDVRSWLDI